MTNLLVSESYATCLAKFILEQCLPWPTSHVHLHKCVCTCTVITCINLSLKAVYTVLCLPSPSNQSFYRQITGYGMVVGDHEVA